MKRFDLGAVATLLAVAFTVLFVGQKTTAQTVFTPGVISQGVELALLDNPSDTAGLIDSIVTSGGIAAAGITSDTAITSSVLESPNGLEVIVDVWNNGSNDINLGGFRVQSDSNDSLDLFDDLVLGNTSTDYNGTTLRGFVLESDGTTLTEVIGPGSGAITVNRIVGSVLRISGTSVASLGDFDLSVLAEQNGGLLGAAQVGADLATTSVTVPEPASLALLAVGGLLVFSRRR